MITHPVDDDIPRDRSLMRTIVRDFGHELGIYARIATPGTITLTVVESDSICARQRRDDDSDTELSRPALRCT